MPISQGSVQQVKSTIKSIEEGTLNTTTNPQTKFTDSHLSHSGDAWKNKGKGK